MSDNASPSSSSSSSSSNAGGRRSALYGKGRLHTQATQEDENGEFSIPEAEKPTTIGDVANSKAAYLPLAIVVALICALLALRFAYLGVEAIKVTVKAIGDLIRSL